LLFALAQHLCSQKVTAHETERSVNNFPHAQTFVQLIIIIKRNRAKHTTIHQVCFRAAQIISLQYGHYSCFTKCYNVLQSAHTPRNVDGYLGDETIIIQVPIQVYFEPVPCSLHTYSQPATPIFSLILNFNLIL
jgi:hypothetical protein